MASNIIETLFTAEENISEALDDISIASDNTESQVSSLDRELQELSGGGQLAQDSFQRLKDATSEVAVATSEADRDMRNINTTLGKLDAGLISGEEATVEMRDAVNSLLTTAEGADRSIDGLESELQELSSAGLITNRAAEDLESSISELRNQSILSSQGIKELSRAFTVVGKSTRSAANKTDGYGSALSKLTPATMAAALPQRYLADSVDDAGDEMDEAGRSAKSLTGDLSILSAVAGTSAFEFSSLSINIGPFNLALQNLLTQLPAILTGMSTMIAIVTSLATAFLTLGAVTGALLAGGALAFFEEFSAQFEESAEATEALMGALKDLFTEALAPLMTEANMDLFISTINGAARLVNRFAQFVAQMRDEVLAFVGDIDADIDSMFEAMHDAFVILQPILKSFIEFFLNDFPDIIVMFAMLTREISREIGMLMSSLGGLIKHLLEFAAVILSVVAPILVVVVKILSAFFAILDAMPETLEIMIIALIALSFIVSLIVVKFFALAHALQEVNEAMKEDKVAGTVLQATYSTLHKQTMLLLAGNQSLYGVLVATKTALAQNIVMWLNNLQVKVANIFATNALSTALLRQIIITKKLIAGKLSLITAMRLTMLNAYKLVASLIMSAGAMLYNAGSAIIAAIANMTLAGAFWAVVGAASTLLTILGTIVAPILALIAVVGLLILGLSALFSYFTNAKPIKMFASAIDVVINKIKTAVGWLARLVGLGMLVGGPDMSVADVDDIQSEANVDLDFQDNLEQNMDVQADPEDSALLKRTIKDAIEEANSEARRRQGTQ